MFFAATESPSTGVKFDLVEVQHDVYKLVFEAMTASTIIMLETTFSFDNSIISPVRASNSADVTITDGGSSVHPFLIIAEDVQEGNPFLPLPVEWVVDGNRTAFRFGMYASPGQEPHYAISDSSYIEMFEFHFRLQPGKSLEDITSSTFNFENSFDINNFVEIFSPIPENGIGTHLKEAFERDYFWGAVDQERYPDSIDEIINPFAQPGLIIPTDPDEQDPTEPTYPVDPTDDISAPLDTTDTSDPNERTDTTEPIDPTVTPDPADSAEPAYTPEPTESLDTTELIDTTELTGNISDFELP